MKMLNQMSDKLHENDPRLQYAIYYYKFIFSNQNDIEKIRKVMTFEEFVSNKIIH